MTAQPALHFGADKVCDNCRFFHREDQECRRRTPAIEGRRWPLTSAEDWCGEWKHKPEQAKVSA